MRRRRRAARNPRRGTTGLAAILFDLDGVLVDSEPLHHRAFEIALEPLGVSGIPFDVYAEHFTSRGRGLEYSERHYGAEPTELFLRKQQVYQGLLKREARLRPGVARTVTDLAREWPLGLATNSPREEAAFVLQKFGLAGSFAAVVGREDYARPKPAPDPFLEAAARLGARPGECLVVEDAYRGLMAAVAAGMRCVVVPNDYTCSADFSQARALLPSLRELTPDVARACFRDVA